MKLRKLLFGLMAAGFAFAAQAVEPIVIKFSHVVANETPKGKGPRSSKSWRKSTPKGP